MLPPGGIYTHPTIHTCFFISIFKNKVSICPLITVKLLTSYLWFVTFEGIKFNSNAFPHGLPYSYNTSYNYACNTIIVWYCHTTKFHTSI